MYPLVLLHLMTVMALHAIAQQSTSSQGSATSQQSSNAQQSAGPGPPKDFAGEDTPYRVQPGFGNYTQENIFGTWLYGYTGCSAFPGAKGKIDGAYYDAWLISNTEGVYRDIDWNNAAALEFLGAPGLNQEKQPQIQALFANVATVIYTYKNFLFPHYIKVRCDDPFKRCQNRPDQVQPDPCDPNPPAPTATGTGTPSATPAAYATNSDPDDGYPLINFCQGFFDKRNTEDAVAYGTNLKSPGRYDLRMYESRGRQFLHELMHLDLAADSPMPNPRVSDLTIDIKYGTRGNTLKKKAYGVALTKVLARFQSAPGLGTTGYWVQRNADNLAFYAYAKYITEKLGVYPHLPIVIREIDGVPYMDRPGLLAEFVGDGSNFYLNSTDDAQILRDDGLGEIGDGYNCSDDLNDDNSVLEITGFAPTSAYPDAYNSQVSSWITDLNAASTAGPSSTTTTPPSSLAAAPSSAAAAPSSAAAAPPSYATGTCSFHLKETQDCEPDSKNLFAIVDLKDAAGNDIGDTIVNSANDPIGQGINDGTPYDFDSALPEVLIITGEHEHDYIQFDYGGVHWGSRQPNDGAYCDVGGWDPRDGPICVSQYETQFADNNMDCYFPC